MKIMLSALLIIAWSAGIGQSKEYMYYFDKDLNVSKKAHAIFYGTGSYNDSLLTLMLYNNKDKHLIMIEHFTDSALQLSEGLFSSFYTNKVKESEGNYAKGKEDGWWERWDSSGNIIDSSLYVNGKIAIKTYYSYFPGKKIRSISWDDMANHKFWETDFDESGTVTRTDTARGEDEEKVFIKTEIEAQFPGGAGAFTTYITKSIEQHIDDFTKKDYGTCMVRFIVRKDGKITNVMAYGLTMVGTKLAEIAIAAIRNGPNWIPAIQNGYKVNAYRIQPVTMTGRE